MLQALEEAAPDQSAQELTEFTPIASLIGGVLIGLAAVALMATHGRIAGVSGIAAGLLPPYRDRAIFGRLAFISGLIASPLFYAAATGSWPDTTITGDYTLLIVSGLLVGFGTVWGSGCTSGHGICGLARLSTRSLVAVAVFMATAVLTVYLMRHVV